MLRWQLIVRAKILAEGAGGDAADDDADEGGDSSHAGDPHSSYAPYASRAEFKLHWLVMRTQMSTPSLRTLLAFLADWDERDRRDMPASPAFVGRVESKLLALLGSPVTARVPYKPARGAAEGETVQLRTYTPLHFVRTTLNSKTLLGRCALGRQGGVRGLCESV
jgi:hypothetical protein